ncbi:hypothetical protein QZR14_22835 [Pseudomonas sp. rhizo66]|uniref:hypothetical protein n=1 Tax=Pseudomonas sp. rhizo66 TaxID=3059674 RepID=UPI002890F9AF|nr:hypothetical protein [Pseudomonas sp. rhizo66]MDT3314207.1 hypothetical protein [Pseudomonas sp. rhizo66]
MSKPIVACYLAPPSCRPFARHADDFPYLASVVAYPADHRRRGAGRAGRCRRAKKVSETIESFVLGKAGVPAASELLATRQTILDAGSALAGIPGMDSDALDNGLILITELLERDRSYVNAACANLEINEFYSEGVMGTLKLAFDLANDNVGTDKARTISREQIQKDITLRLAQANRGRELLARYRQYSKEKAA